MKSFWGTDEIKEAPKFLNFRDAKPVRGLRKANAFCDACVSFAKVPGGWLVIIDSGGGEGCCSTPIQSTNGTVAPSRDGRDELPDPGAGVFRTYGRPGTGITGMIT